MFRSPLLYAVVLSFVFFIAYTIGHWKIHNNFELYSSIPGALAVFGVVLNVVLMFKLIAMGDEKLGELKGEKATIVTGVVFTVFYAFIEVLNVLDRVY